MRMSRRSTNGSLADLGVRDQGCPLIPLRADVLSFGFDVCYAISRRRAEKQSICRTSATAVSNFGPTTHQGCSSFCATRGRSGALARGLMAVLSWQTPSFSVFLRIGAEPQTFACVGLTSRPAEIKTTSVNLLGSIRRLCLVRLGGRLRRLFGNCLEIRVRTIVARWTTIGRVVLVFSYLDAFSVQALSGRSLRRWMMLFIGPSVPKSAHLYDAEKRIW